MTASRILLVPCALLLLAMTSSAQAPTLLVSGYNSDSVHRFDGESGAHLGDLGSVPGAQSIRFGPDGLLYVCSEKSNQVLRFDGVTGAPLGPFVFDDPLTPADETGGLSTPTGAVFGHDGNLYVASFDNDNVLRYDGTTGAFLDIFVDASSGNINGPDAGLDFGPDGHLYVPSFNNNRVLRYHGKTGVSLGTFAPPGLSVLSRPRSLRWRGDGLMYVSSWGNNRVLRYDLQGNLVDTLVNTPRPTGLAFGPNDGDLYVTSDQSSDVLRFDGTSGAAKGTLISAGGGVVDGGTYLEFLPDPELRLGRPAPGLAGMVNTLSVRNATPSSVVFLAVGGSTASVSLGCAQDFFGVASPTILVLQSDTQGDVEVSAPVALGAANLKAVMQAFDASGGCLSNLVIARFD